jgi:hypothetical protein
MPTLRRDNLANQLNGKRIGNAEHKRTIWDVDAAAGDTLLDLLRPDYWSHVARNLRPKDRIEVICEDNSYFAELYVFEASSNWAKVGLLRYDVFAENAAQHGVTAQGTPEYKITHGGNVHKWRVIRTADGECITKNQPFTTQREAEEWLFEYRKALAK